MTDPAARRARITFNTITGATQAERDLMAQTQAETDEALAESHPWAVPGPAARDWEAVRVRDLQAALADREDRLHAVIETARAHQAAHRDRRALALAARVIEAATTGKRWWQQ